MSRVRDREDYMTENVRVEDIPRYFDNQLHDYVHGNNGSTSTRISTLVQVQWMDPPGLHPGDIRSRHMVVNIKNSDLIPAYQHHKL
ncbi:MAG: hypothetical protein ASARMPRED_001719, partial [Alectoria sarmentosa]